MPDEWRRSTVVLIYKNERDKQNYTNYHGIKLMSHTIKIQERVVKQTLKHKTKKSEWEVSYGSYLFT